MIANRIPSAVVAITLCFVLVLTVPAILYAQDNSGGDIYPEDNEQHKLLDPHINPLASGDAGDSNPAQPSEPNQSHDVSEPSSVEAGKVTLNFDTLQDQQVLSTQYSNTGITFEGAKVLGQGASLNHVGFPPHSGLNVIYDDEDVNTGRITVVFDVAKAGDVRTVGAYVTGNRNVTMTAFDANGNQLRQVATGGLNYAPDGTPNMLLEIATTAPIQKIVFFNGGERGNTYTVDDFYFNTQVSCAIADVPLYKQGGTAEWGGDLYGGTVSAPWYETDKYGNVTSKKALFRDWGCATTSAAMIVSHYGIQQGKGTATPRELNNWLRSTPGGYSGGSIQFRKVAEFARVEKGIALYYYGSGGADVGIVNASLCNRAPMIVQTWASPYDKYGHFLVVTGTSGENRWTVNDPGGYNLSTLGTTSFAGVRKFGTTQSAPAFLSLVIHAPPSVAAAATTSLSKEEISELTITDPAGRRLVFNSEEGITENGILDGILFREEFGPAGQSGRSIGTWFFETGAPIDGEYKVTMVGARSGHYAVDLLAFDENNESSAVGISGFAVAETETQLRVEYNIEDASEVQLVPKFQGLQLFLPSVLK